MKFIWYNRTYSFRNSEGPRSTAPERISLKISRISIEASPNKTTNSAAKTAIFTYGLDSEGTWVAVLFGQTKNGDLEVVPPPSKTTTDAEGNTVPVDDMVYREALDRQQWTCICQSKLTTTTRKVDEYQHDVRDICHLPDNARKQSKSTHSV